MKKSFMKNLKLSMRNKSMTKLQYLKEYCQDEEALWDELNQLSKRELKKFRKLVKSELPKYCPRRGYELIWYVNLNIEKGDFDMYTGKAGTKKKVLKIEGWRMSGVVPEYYYLWKEGMMDPWSVTGEKIKLLEED